MQRFNIDLRRAHRAPCISWVRHFGMGLGLGLEILILLQVLFHPFQFSRPQSQDSPRPALSADVAALGRSLRHSGFSDTHHIVASLQRMRSNSQGRIAWIQLRNSDGMVVAQAGKVAPMMRAANVPVFVKSYTLPLPSGQFGRLDIAIRMEQSGVRKQALASHTRLI